MPSNIFLENIFQYIIILENTIQETFFSSPILIVDADEKLYDLKNIFILPRTLFNTSFPQ